MKKIFLFCFFFYATVTQAQTTMEMFKAADVAFESANDYGESAPKLVAENQLTPASAKDNINEKFQKALDLYEQISKTGESGAVKLAKFLHLRAEYRRYEKLIYIKEPNKADFETISELYARIKNYSEADFPLIYKSSAETLTLGFAALSTVKCASQFRVGEAADAIGRPAVAVEYFKLVIENSETVPLFKLITLQRVIDPNGKLRTAAKLSNNQRCDYYAQMVEQYYLLNAKQKKERQTLLETAIFDLNVEGVYLSNRPTNLPECFARVAVTLDSAGEREKAFNFFESTVNDDYKKPVFLKAAEINARSKKVSEEPIGYDKVTNEEKATKVALKALNQLAALSVTNPDCEQLAYLAEAYTFWHLNDRAATFQQRAVTCKAERLEAERRAEIKRRRIVWRTEHPFHMYAGLYILPAVLGTVKHLGGELEIRTGKYGHGFSFNQEKQGTGGELLIKEGSNNITPVPYDGFNVHYMYRYYDGDQNTIMGALLPFFKGYGYVGLQLDYTDRKFNPTIVQLTESNTGAVLRNQLVNATEKRYAFIFNKGWLYRLTPLGINFSFGAGVTYSDFKSNSTNFDSDTRTSDNNYFNAKKASPWGFTFRLGLSTGLGF